MGGDAVPENSAVGDQRQTAILVEYQIVAESWRQLLNVRFALIPFVAALESAIMVAYRYASAHLIELGVVGDVGLLALPAFGVMATFAIMIIEWRTKLVRHSCLVRALTIEFALGNTEGVFHRIESSPAPFGFATQTITVRLIYLGVYAAWMYLLFNELVT